MTEKEKLLSDLDGLTYDDWHMFHSDTEVQGIATDAFKYIQEQPEWRKVKDDPPKSVKDRLADNSDAMADWKKVVKGLSVCTNRGVGKYDEPGCPECPYYSHLDEQWCMDMLHADALELLDKQEPRPIAYSTNSYTGLPIAHCPKCLRPIRMFFPGAEEETHFCPRCGQELMWDE